MGDLGQDLRYAVRMLTKRPAFTAVAVLTLGLGIGANAAIFSVVNGVLFKGVPGLEDTDGLVELSRDVQGRFWDVSYPVYQHLRDKSETLESLSAMAITPLALSGDGEPTVHMGMAVTRDYFPMLRLVPGAGRFFAEDEASFPQVASVAVITDGLWERRFDRRPDVVGETIRVNGHATEIVGIAPPGFSGHVIGAQIELFVPVGMPAPGLESAASLRSPQSSTIEMFGRLRPGATPEQARAELSLLADAFNRETTPGAGEGGFVVRVEEWAPVPAIVRTGVKAFFTVLMTIVALVLAMACTNVSSMILSRSTDRRQEIATRLALGAGRCRVVRQLLTESSVLFLAGGAVGLAVAYWAVRLLLTFEPPLPPGILIDLDLGLDWRVVGFALGVSLVTGILFSLAPALHATGGQLVAALKDASAAGAPARTRLRSVMVAGQMAVTVTLLIVAGLFLRALTTLETLDPGWDAEGVHVLDMDLELSGYEPERGLQFYAELTERVRQIPGIESSAIAAKLPLGGRSSFGDVNVRDVPAPEGRFGHEAYLNRVSPGYFETMGLVLKQGRDVQDTDTATSPMVAVINEAMARRLWPAGDAVGQGFWLGTVGDGQRIEVIGVVENAKYRRLVEDTPNFYYIPYQQRYNAQMTLHFRAGGAPERAIAEVRRAVRELDAGLPVLSFRNLAAALDMFFLPQRLAAWVAASMGVLGLLLAAVGVYGISAYNVAQRRREIGVRIALGATPLDVVRLTLRRGLVAPLVGMSLGLALAFVITRLMLGFLAGISPLDPLTFGSVVFGLLAVAGSAVLLATRRATRLDPVATLRAE